MSIDNESRKSKILKISNFPNKKSHIKRYIAISSIIFLNSHGMLPVSKGKFLRILNEVAGLTHDGRIDAFANEKRGHHHDILQISDGYLNIKDDIKQYLISLNWELSSENKNKVIHTREPRIVENRKIHKNICSHIISYLCNKHGRENVGKEQPSGYGANKIDIVVNDENRFIFYEVKAHTSITMCIREALGQLLEYSYFPNRSEAFKLIIVTQHVIDSDAQSYVEHIRTLFNIPIYYQTFDLNTNVLSVEY